MAGLDSLLGGLDSPNPLKKSTSSSKSSPAANGGFSSPSAMLPPSHQPKTRFEERDKPFSTQEFFGDAGGREQLGKADRNDLSSIRVALSTAIDVSKYSFRYMFEKLTERSETLDSVIDDAAAVFQAHYTFIPAFDDPSIASQASIYAIGRICSELAPASTSNTKLSDTSCVLETSRVLGQGKRVPLRFDKKLKVRSGTSAPKGANTAMGLFPGAIVAVKGKNSGGNAFAVEEILDFPLPEPAYTLPSTVLKSSYESKLAGQPMSVVVASGPYTLSSDLAYKPLEELLNHVARDVAPDVLILLGPFVDASHPSFSPGFDGEQMTPHDVWKRRIAPLLNRFTDAKKGGTEGTLILLVPNQKDLGGGTQAAFPQGPIEKDPELNLSKRVKLLPNPTTFSVNEVAFGVASADVLLHLRNQELLKRGTELGDEVEEVENEMDIEAAPGGELDENVKDAMNRAVRQVIRHQSYYPLFPAPLGSNPNDPITASQVNLDMTHYSLVKIGPPTPDILVLPSMLKYFIRVVDNTVVINPSYLVSRGTQPGTFAKITIYPLPKDELKALATPAKGEDEEDEEEDPIDHRLWERTRVDIVKI